METKVSFYRVNKEQLNKISTTNNLSIVTHNNTSWIAAYICEAGIVNVKPKTPHIEVTWFLD